MLAVKYALRDLRGTFGALRIVIMCLVLGVAAIASVQFISRSVLESIAQDGRNILGADLIVRTANTPADDDVYKWFLERDAVLSESIETRSMIANDISDESTLVELKGVDGEYPLYGAFETDSGKDIWDLLSGKGVLLDEALRERLGVSVGDRVRLGEGVFTVRGFIVNEPDRAGGARFGLAPRVIAKLSDLKNTGLLEAGSMVGYDLRVRLPQGADLPAVRQALESEFKSDDLKVTDADNASPRLTSFIERLMVFLTLVGMSALLIGGIGIGNGVRAYLQTRTQTIAILKAIGAPVRLIERMYAVQIILISIIGCAIGITLGVIAPFVVLPYLQGVLPFSVQPRLDVLGAFVPVCLGFLIVGVFTLWPLGQAVLASPLSLFRGAAEPVRGKPDARYRILSGTFALMLIALAIGGARDVQFALWFVMGALFCLIMFWLLGKLIAFATRNMRFEGVPVLQLAIRYLHAPGNATAATLVSLGLGLTVLMSVSLIELNLREGIQRNLPDDAPAFFFLDIQSSQKDGFEALLKAQPDVGKVMFSPNLRGRIVSINGVPAEDALKDENERWLLQNDRGFTYETDLPAHSEVLTGEWWAPDYDGPPLVSVVEDVVKAFGVGVGDEITVNILGRNITAKVANTRSVNWMNFTINYAITFAPGTLEKAPHGYLATAVADASTENAIQRAVVKAYPNITMIRLSEAVEAAGSVLSQMAVAVRLLALVAVVSGVFVLAGSLAATRTQRLYDTVVLKVLGVRGSVLLRAFLLEFGLLGVLAGGISLGLGAVISWAVMVHLMDLTWHFYLIESAVIGLSGVLLTLVIGVAVTGRVLRAPAAPYLRNE